MKIIPATIIFILSIVPVLISPNIALASVFFEDNFNDGNSYGWEEHSPNGYWSVVTTGENEFEYVGSSTNIQPIQHSYSVTGDRTWQDYTFQIKIKGTEGVDKAILFRVDESGKSYIINLRGLYASTLGNDIILAKGNNYGSSGLVVLNATSFVNYLNTWYVLRVDVKNIIEDSVDKVYIKVYIDDLLILEGRDAENPINNGAIGLAIWPGGGGSPTPSGNLITTTHFDDVLVGTYGVIPSPSPSPSTFPTPSPSPTPTPTPSPTPTSVVIVPGLGASWNAEAILSCGLSTGGTWSLAPYAESLYQPILTALNNAGIDNRLFAYDWRQNLTDEAPVLNDYLSGDFSGEEVNLVGHSLGGLLGRAYLEQVKENNQLNKFLSVGSPHKGTALAYYPWEGGDIPTGELWQKIAINILFRHCGLDKTNRQVIHDLSPSIGNLLLTTDYLKDWKTGVTKLVGTMQEQNTWSHVSSLTFPFSGVDFGTLSGTGFETLNTIKIKSRNSHDAFLGDWIDGKPAGKETVMEGDGTVLLESSSFPDATSLVISQDHTGLISSPEGIGKILEFLGLGNLGTLSNLGYSEPKSALIIIGYPANFWVVDEKGKIIKDKDGMVSFLNPKSGKYKFGLLPRSGQTLFIVAQFLENGKTLYKEYNFKNFLPKFGRVNFDAENSSEDPLVL